MHERLLSLKAQREAERQAEVQRRYDQKFKMENDALRKEDAKFYTAGTQIEREKQLIDKRRQIEQKMMEEQVYAQLYHLDAQKKLERELQEAQEKQALVKDTLTVLDWQKQTRSLEKSKEQAHLTQERAMLAQQWEAEMAREKQKQAEAYVLNLERNKDLIRHNEQEKDLRQQAELAEKQRDLQLLNQSLAREAAIEQLEAEAREQHRRETMELQKFAGEAAADRQAYEKMVEGLVARENEKQWSLREQQWDREDQARVNLLKNVYASREQEVALHKQKREEGDWMKQYERKNMESEVER